jgi:hypothetical protein
VIYGRREERALIADLLAGAHEARSGVLVIRGEAGIGKHTLLQDAARQASDFHLLHAAGAESELGLPFAALHQLLRPVLDRVDRLPILQAAALRGAFGLLDTESRPSRFLVELGLLGLLVELACKRPVLCLVRDAQWLDQASADALVFVARRLQHDRIVLLLAARDDDVRQFHADGLPELHLGGLDAASAGELLEASAGKIAPQVRDRLIEETGGNPLALRELPATLTSEQLAGRELLPERIPLSARLQQAFLQRVRQLPEATQTLLLVAAAEDTGELADMLAAGQDLGCDAEALGPAEQAGLVQVVGSELQFCHPLVRSANYDAATFTARQAAHQALVTVLQGDQHADRRAWHLAAATLGPDEQVAGALEDLADRARRRGGPPPAAPPPGGGPRRCGRRPGACRRPHAGGSPACPQAGRRRRVQLGGRAPGAGAGAAGPGRAGSGRAGGTGSPSAAPRRHRACRRLSRHRLHAPGRGRQAVPGAPC